MAAHKRHLREVGPRLEAGRYLHGAHVVAALTRAIEERAAAPRNIAVDNGSEFTGRALEAWAIQHDPEPRIAKQVNSDIPLEPL